MPRRSAAQIRPLEPDARHRNRLVQQVINKVMRDGKKSLAERIVYDSLAIVGENSGEDAVETLEAAIKQLTPVLEVRSRRVGGATYQVPVEVPARRARTLAVRWLVDYARNRREYSMADRLAGEILDADPAAGQRLEAEGRHLPHGPGQQGLRALPLVGDLRPVTRPMLAVDVDGVISLFGFDEPPPGSAARFELDRRDGALHLARAPAERLRRLGEHFEMVWATGWEEKANDYLPNLLGLPELPYLTFDGAARFGSAHWKLGPLDEYGSGRALAWIDDSFDQSCYEWAQQPGGADAARPDRVRPRPRGGPDRGADRLGAQPRHVASLD